MTRPDHQIYRVPMIVVADVQAASYEDAVLRMGMSVRDRLHSMSHNAITVCEANVAVKMGAITLTPADIPPGLIMTNYDPREHEDE